MTFLTLYLITSFSLTFSIISSDEDKRIYDEKDEYGNIEGNPRIMKIFKKAMKYERNINDNYKTIDGNSDNERDESECDKQNNRI